MRIFYSGKVTVYLGKRDFIDHLDHIDPIDGVLVVENDYLQGRKIFGQVNKILTFSMYIYIIHIPMGSYSHVSCIYIIRSRQPTDMAAKRTKLWESSSAKS